HTGSLTLPATEVGGFLSCSPRTRHHGGCCDRLTPNALQRGRLCERYGGQSHQCSFDAPLARILGLRMRQSAALAPDGPARPKCRVECHTETPLKRPYIILISPIKAKAEHHRSTGVDFRRPCGIEQIYYNDGDLLPSPGLKYGALNAAS